MNLPDATVWVQAKRRQKNGPRRARRRCGHGGEASVFEAGLVGGQYRTVPGSIDLNQPARRRIKESLRGDRVVGLVLVLGVRVRRDGHDERHPQPHLD